MEEVERGAAAAATETIEGVKPPPLARSLKEVEPLEALPEEAAASEGAPYSLESAVDGERADERWMADHTAVQDGSTAEDAPVGGGRRARKSVNYALPKLNT